MTNEKELGKVICKAIKEATGTPIEFEEGCRERHCDSCIFSKLPKALINEGYGNVKQAIKEFTEQLLNQLKANLKFIENPDNYFAMFRYVIEGCIIARTVNSLLFDLEALNDYEFSSNVRRIQEARQNAIKVHGEWTIQTLEQSKAKHTVRTFVSTLYSDIFEIELK